MDLLAAVALGVVLLAVAVWSALALPGTGRAASGAAETENPCADGVADISVTIQVCTVITGSLGVSETLLTQELTIAASTVGIPGIGSETLFQKTVGGVAAFVGMAPHLDWTISVLERVLPPGVRYAGPEVFYGVRVGDAVTIRFICDAPPCDQAIPTSTPFLSPTPDDGVTPSVTPGATSTASPTLTGTATSTVPPTEATASLTPSPTPTSAPPEPTTTPSPSPSPTERAIADTATPEPATNTPEAPATLVPSATTTAPPTATGTTVPGYRLFVPHLEKSRRR